MDASRVRNSWSALVARSRAAWAWPRRRSISLARASARERAALTWPWRRTTPSRRSEAARTAARSSCSAVARAASAAVRTDTAMLRAARCSSTARLRSASWPRIARDSFSMSSGARPRRSSSGSGARLRTRSEAMPTVPASRSRRPDRANHVSWAAVSAGASAMAAASRTASADWALASSASTSARRSRTADSSATSCSYCEVSVCRSSASRRRAASRTSVWMTFARRATSACLPSGVSWRRSSVVRSCTRVRLACIASSLRTARSLRLRCFRTPAASSMNPRRSSGVACRIWSSWPWPTITCISRPMPESLSSSWMSSRRQAVPLMEYSEPPERNITREIVTSE